MEKNIGKEQKPKKPRTAYYPTDIELYRREGIRGWLLFFTIILAASIVMNIYLLNQNTFYINYLINGFQYTTSYPFGELLIMILFIATIVLYVLTFIFLLRKKIIFRRLFIWGIAAYAAMKVTCIIVEPGSIDAIDFILGFADPAIWIAYLFRSVRVKAVFGLIKPEDIVPEGEK